MHNVPTHTTTLLDTLAESPVRAAIREALGVPRSPQAGSPSSIVVHTLTDERFAPCKGCFECWVKTPGQCGMRDAANAVMADCIHAEELIWTTRVRFGCWEARAKATLDRTIGIVSPFFTTVHGETHHRARYDRYPRWGVIAVADDHTTHTDRRRFSSIVARNVVNMQQRKPWVAFVPPDATADDVAAAVHHARAHPLENTTAPPFLPPTAKGVSPRADRPRHVVAWIGSAKPNGTSTSEALVQPLLDHLAELGWTTEVLHTRGAVKLQHAEAPKLVEAVQRADLLVLSTPVYVDTPPASVLAGLGQLARARLDSPPAMVVISQCGFPELEHNYLLLDVVAEASRRIGMPWAGHLAVGGGGAFTGAHLSKPGDKAWRQARALQDAATALDAGEPIPPTVTESFGHAILGPALYRLAGDVGWLVQAWQHGALWTLGDEPFAGSDDGAVSTAGSGKA